MHHYYYKPSKPAANLYLQKLFDERTYQDHVTAVNKIRSTKLPHFTDKPNSFKYLRPLKTSRDSTQDSRAQSENQRLIHSSSQLSNQSQTSVSASYSQLEMQSIYHQSSMNLQKDPKTKPISTTQENALMFKRIKNVKSTISRQKQEKDWNKSRYYKAIATHYPENWKEFADNNDKIRDLSMSLIKEPSTPKTVLPPIKSNNKT